MGEQVFSGFPIEGLLFLADLEANNDKVWFDENKSTYLHYVVEPSLEFIETVGDQLRFIAPYVQYDSRTNGQGSLMRIYRDVRFSSDKTPYKTWVGIRFWEGSGKANENPGFFFWFDHTGAGIHVGMHGFDKSMLEAYRKAVLNDDQGGELAAVIDEVTSVSGYEVRGEHYKRVPRGYDIDHPRAGLLRYNTLYASSSKIDPALLTSRAITEITMDHFEKMAPLQRWLVKLKHGS